MVKVALAGGLSNVSLEILDALLASAKHEIRVLSRKDAPEALPASADIDWRKVSYDDVDQLADALQGVETVLSFVNEMTEKDPTGQINLIDAAVKAGVKRFAPSEWATAKFDKLEWYTYKQRARDHLRELNKDKKIMEYCIFHPGLFANYMTVPFKSAKHLHPLAMPIDFHNRRAVIREGGENDTLTLTTVQDLASVVAEAVEYEGEWPVVGGIKGATITVAELIAIGERIRGPFQVETVKDEDLETGNLTCSWVPDFHHPNAPAEGADAFAKHLLSRFLLSVAAGSWTVTEDSWNQALPEHKFANIEEFLADAWSKIDAVAQVE